MLRRSFLVSPLVVSDQAETVLREAINPPSDPLAPITSEVLRHFPAELRAKACDALTKASGNGWSQFGVCGWHREVTLRSILGIDPASGLVEFLPKKFLGE